MRSITCARASALALFAAGALGAAAPLTGAQAQTRDDMFKDKGLTIVVGHEPGTGFDLYARTLSRHLPKHLPGKPSALVQNMVGASGVTAFNWLGSVAPKDGTTIAIVAFTVPFAPMLGHAAGRFDASQYNWVGNMDSSVSVCAFSKASGALTFEQARQREVLVGGTGASGPLSQSSTALRALTGAQLKVIEGYKGSASVKLAIERGELHGVCGISLSTARTQYREAFDSGELLMTLQLGLDPHPDLKTVPHVYQYARTPEERQVFDLIFGAQGLGRSFVAPPGVPAERVAVLRAGFAAAMQDPELIAEAEKVQLDLRPQSGEEVQAFIQRVYSAPREVAERARKAVQP
jgi:tripartite-type tricarboxylate transporter receptor subunit TctC